MLLDLCIFRVIELVYYFEYEQIRVSYYYTTIIIIKVLIFVQLKYCILKRIRMMYIIWKK